MKSTLMAATSTFAHLLGRGSAAAAAAVSEDDCPRLKGESDEDYEKRREAAAEEDKKRDDETEEEHEARVKANKAKRAKAADDSQVDDDEDEDGDDESDDKDMDPDAAARTPRMRERARCAAIFADASAGKNPALAATLAFGTDLPRSKAIKVLRAGGAAIPTQAPRKTLDERMARIPVLPVASAGAPDPSAGAGQKSAYNDATAVILAGMKRRGESDEKIAAEQARRAASAPR